MVLKWLQLWLYNNSCQEGRRGCRHMGWVWEGGVSHSPSGQEQLGMLVLCSGFPFCAPQTCLSSFSSSSLCFTGCSLAWGLCFYPEGFEFPHPSCGRGVSLGLVLRVNTPQHWWGWSGDLLEAWTMLSRHLPCFGGWLLCQELPASPCTALASPMPARRAGGGGTGWVRRGFARGQQYRGNLRRCCLICEMRCCGSQCLGAPCGLRTSCRMSSTTSMASTALMLFRKKS